MLTNSVIERKAFSYLLFCFLMIYPTGISLAGSFYQENRNGKTFILQVDPGTGIDTVFNPDKTPVFAAPKAKRVAVLPTAGWGDTVNNVNPVTKQPLGTSEAAGDPNGILTLRVVPAPAANKVEYQIYRGANTLLGKVTDTRRGTEAPNYDIAVSQFMGKNKNFMRVYLYISDFINCGPVIFRMNFEGNVASGPAAFRFTVVPNDPMGGYTVKSSNWTKVTEYGTIAGAQSINVNATSDAEDILVYHPTRQYSLQHVWKPSDGFWGINYLMKENQVLKANKVNRLTNDPSGMQQIFDVGVDLGDAFTDTVLYYRCYYNHGNTFVLNNYTTNSSLRNIYYDIRDAAGNLVDIRDGSPTGAVLERTRVNPNPTIIGHNASALFGLSCRNALTGKELIVYEPVYKINANAVAEGEITDNDNNNIPDHIQNDGLGAFGYRGGAGGGYPGIPASYKSYLIDRDNGSTLDTDYVLDFVIAHRFPLTGVNATKEFTYTELAIQRAGPASPAAFINGETVHVRVGNIAHRDPDVYGEYNQFGWDTSAGNAVFFWIGNGNDPYNTQNDPTFANPGRILGVEVTNTSYAIADYFGVVGNDEWASNQGDLYFLSRQYGEYISPRIVSSNNSDYPPVTGYGLWWKFQYDRSTYYGISRTSFLKMEPTIETETSWINKSGFFIGNSIYSQMVYNVNCGCRGQRYDNFVLDKDVSSPINDFALINIGAPPFVEGTIAPTIQAKSGSAAVLNTPVNFVGSCAGALHLLVNSSVKYRFVMLDGEDGKNVADPGAALFLPAGLKVVDSLVTTGAMLNSPDWSYTFTSKDLKDKDGITRAQATFYVYLLIEFDSYDYKKMPYPFYSWWENQIPTVRIPAWSNSDGGNYTDGQLHGKYGAPLKITVGTKLDSTPQHPLLITSVQVMNGVDNTWREGYGVASQGEKLKIRVKGNLRFLSEIPATHLGIGDEFYKNMGGIMPWGNGPERPNEENNYRGYMNSSGKQYKVYNGATTEMTDIEFDKDLESIKFDWFIKAEILGTGSLVAYTKTALDTSALDDSKYAGGPRPTTGYWKIASGSMKVKNPEGSALNGLRWPGEPDKCIATLTPRPSSDVPNCRWFDFEVETPWFQLPVPLDAGRPDSEITDKYRVRVAFNYPVGEWNPVTVNNYNSAVLTNGFNCRKCDDISPQREMNFCKDGDTKDDFHCYLRVYDTEGPTVSNFAVPATFTTGDCYPSVDLGILVTDNNPNDYIKRGNSPQIKWAATIGSDKYLNVVDETDDSQGLGLNLSKWNIADPFTMPPNTRINNDIEHNPYLAYKDDAISLNNMNLNIASFPGLCSISYEPADGVMIAREAISAPAFNTQPFNMRLYLYDNPQGSGEPQPDMTDTSYPAAVIRDGSGNLFRAGIASGSIAVVDNDPPNIRVYIQDGVNLDAMIEVRGGLKDDLDSVFSTRHLSVKNLLKKDGENIIYENDVATTTSVVDVQSGLSETYSLTQIAALASVTNMPFVVTPDARFKITAEAYDNSGPKRLDVSLRFTDAVLSGVPTGRNLLKYIFRRGVSGTSYQIEATVQDDYSSNRVTILIPIVVGQPSPLEIRTIEESSKKQF